MSEVLILIFDFIKYCFKRYDRGTPDVVGKKREMPEVYFPYAQALSDLQDLQSDFDDFFVKSTRTLVFLGAPFWALQESLKMVCTDHGCNVHFLYFLDSYIMAVCVPVYVIFMKNFPEWGEKVIRKNYNTQSVTQSIFVSKFLFIFIFILMLSISFDSRKDSFGFYCLETFVFIYVLFYIFPMYIAICVQKIWLARYCKWVLSRPYGEVIPSKWVPPKWLLFLTKKPTSASEFVRARVAAYSASLNLSERKSACSPSQ